MAIPDFQTLMRPVLEFAVAADERAMKETHPALADLFNLTEEERDQLLPSGRVRLFHNRVTWAVTHLKKAGMLEPRRRGVYAITEKGRMALKQAPERVTLNYLMQFEDYREFRNKSNLPETNTFDGCGSQSSSPIKPDEQDEGQTPEEVLGSAWTAIRDNLETDLLDQMKQVSPSFFEQVVVDVLVAMGYGGERSDAARSVGQSGDGGIDGIIDEDPLGLDVIYLQAKRWENVVGRPEIQKFAGALQGRRAKKGVFITTSHFTREARAYADMLENRIILIDGRKLARLMIDHDVGVSPVEQYVIKRLDTDYFAGE
ncbi:restriction endonuclease [Halomonas halocynthiae]|uniref:restriction endonuclease n=1 Tax=Halomonas halocynthiae TaxID=176290 RepID=UPI0004265977|nr:restriction endonuclease [Halomonas halocynthiae]